VFEVPVPPDHISILYVDDEPDLLEVTKLFLEKTGQFSVETCTSPLKAREILASTRYDAIVSDYQMPEMDGIEFLKRVRGSGNTIPFILFTGRGREEVVIEALNSGADFYLQKGGDPRSQFAELMHKIKIAVQQRRAEERVVIQNRLYSVLSATNKAIVHIRDKTGLFSEICRILVEIGGFRMVWIGLADLTKKRIEPAASAGYIDGYLDFINISTEYISHGRGPTGTAYREGKYYYCNDILTDPRMEPWRDAAIHRGYLANAAIPFALGTRDAGVVTLYAPTAGFFDEQVIGLLEEMARDITFALRTIDEEERRKVAEDALSASEVRYRNVVEDQTEFICRFTPDGRLTFVNDAYCRYFGLDKGTCIGTRHTVVIPSGDLERMNQHLSGFSPQNPFGIIEHRIIMPSGDVRWQHWSDRAIFDESGTLIEYQSVGRDITETKRAEEELWAKNAELYTAYEQIAAREEDLRTNLNELTRRELALQESKRELADIIEFLPDATFVIDREGTVIAWNRAMKEMTGISKDEMIGQGDYAYTIPFYGERRKHLLDLIDLDDEELKAKYHYVARKGGTLYAEVFTPALYGGKGAYVWATGSSLFDLNGHRIGAIESIRDITDRKTGELDLLKKNEELHAAFEQLTATEEEMRQNYEELAKSQQQLAESERKGRMSEAFLSGVINGAREGITACDRELRYILWNRFMENLTGIPAAEVLGKPAVEMFPVLKKAGADRLMEQALSGHTVESSDFSFHIARSGRQGSVRAIYSPLSDTDGTIIGVIGIIRDTMARKVMEHALQTTIEQLMESDEKYRQCLQCKK